MEQNQTPSPSDFIRDIIDKDLVGETRDGKGFHRLKGILSEVFLAAVKEVTAVCRKKEKIYTTTYR